MLIFAFKELDMLMLAPLMGYTDYVFRNVFTTHFNGIDLAIAPYVSLAEGKRVKKTHIRDLLPENNRAMPIIPQVMGTNIDQFFVMARDLQQLGYKSVNWNLGCPMRIIARKKRGSGLLPYPEIIQEVMEQVIPLIGLEFSIKTRLGYHHADEIDKLIPVFNSQPLDFLVVHPRIGTQLYEGPINYEKLSECIGQVKTDIVYSGDIWNVDIYRDLKRRYPEIKHWMLGRGLMKNLFLAEEINNKVITNENKMLRFLNFHHHLIDALEERMVMEKNVMNKLKEYWVNFQDMFTDGQKIFDELKYLGDVDSFRETSEKLCKKHGIRQKTI